MIKFLLILNLLNPTTQDSIPLVDSNRILEESYRLIGESQYDSALILLKCVHPADSNFHKVSYRMASCYVYSEQTAKADSLQAMILERDHVDSDFFIQYGNAYSNTGNYDKAISVYTKGLDRFPYNHYLLYNIGFAMSKQGKNSEAMEYVQEALSISPFYSPAHQILGNLCSDLGFRTKALLAYACYLAMNPDQNWALVKMNNLSNNAYRQEGSVDSNGLDNSAFEFFDNLNRSGAALDDRFKSAVDFEAPVTQQFELLLKMLKADSESQDFWMHYYVPAFEKIESEGLTADFVYFLLSSTNNEDVQAYLQKNEKRKDAWIDILNSAFTKNRESHERTIGNTLDTYTHWYRGDGSLSAIGNELGEKNVGPWVYYYANGFKNAEGEYADHGDKQGTWYYYHDNGQISSVEFHDESGLVQGKISRYSREGILTSVTSYKDDSLHGNWKAFYPIGSVREVYPYVEGTGNGEGMTFFKNGGIKSKYDISNGEVEGELFNYHKNGSISSSYWYKEGKLEGGYKSFYASGQEAEIGSYKNDLATGVWQYFHPNGQLSSKGAYNEGEKVGEWLYYNSRGTIETQEEYGEGGVLNGLTYLYDMAGNKYVERDYRNDTLVAYRYFTAEDETIYEQSDLSGDFEDFRYYYPSGNLKSKGGTLGGVLEGPFKTFHLSGVIQQEGTMKEGNWDGPYKEYDVAGNLLYSYSNKEANPDGYYTEYYPNGKLKKEGWLQDGQPQQLWIDYWMDGTKRSESYYVNGSIQGWSKQFGPHGRLFEMHRYVDNEQRVIVQYDTLGTAFNTLNIFDSTQISTLNYVSGSPYFETRYKFGEAAEDIMFYYPDHAVLSEYPIENTEYNGEYKNYDLLGRLVGKGSYKDDQQTGEWLYYYDNGAVSTKYTYVNDVLQGPSYDYFEDGGLKIENSYFDGEQHGKRVRYGPSGEIALIKHYIKDYGPVTYQYQKADGSLSDFIPIATKGVFEIKSYYPNGKVAVIQQYKDFYFDGQVAYYYENGNLLRKTMYEKGERNGPSKSYYSNGKLKMVIPYYFGEKHGSEIKYYENGQVKASVEYQFGTKNGLTRFFSDDGSLLKEVYYWNGKIYSE